ncbi:hydantoinase/oxoprolinase family protein [Reyranella sp.]|jgi:N-methylhydantoinase A|uniref:hydantoinase/oxoprolinase family protein n=1 Tax=Reyranella sp. TaxID=1929291 RepID=UPI000BC610DA|nr:hydantoinase/oxoprolinase family protein [Reyranella sp.]OYY46748.1 MAG: methylhydantoinase [Rhodospirillales bacterium 35-66-84]OYZ96768.1 MAG: methylhydantoinase [Rhodospirillales bacterium 24-66-33]OZB27905.1 MAG: methylhydantoinase [Rhodospirillales bacterium 39-66-50]HQS13653.1 hydantoinase/oxoprolinase family protein [Reyranella sp.]HQT10138.1 hydantoinase/oxoprolinase family protein [Reyranella sp.]
MSSRLAVDIGGTFTDVVLETGAKSHAIKVLTTPDAPERAVLEGVRAILAEAKCRPQDVTLVVHGTTLATNALIERKGARTALITTEGFRDSVEMAWEHRFEQYDIHMERPQPLVSRDLRFGVPERVASDGAVLLALDEQAVRRVAAHLKAEKIEAVAVCFLHSFTNEAHERRTGAILAEELPGVAVSLSCEVCPEIREYERTSTTIANAYVLPRMEGYLGQLETDLKKEGIAAPLLLMMSSGGITTVDTARRYPVRLVESGPAGGAILARAVAAENDARKAVAFDMGGTTAKLTLLDDLELQRSRQFEVARAYRFVQGSGLPVRIPVIELVEIGAGGGSIARLDALGRIQVGPDSAGSVPGPACYGRGGTEPTVTDADTALGRLDPTRFAGGAIPLHRDKAEAALQVLAGPLGTDAQGAAAGVAEIVDETMASAARVHAVENGKDTADRTLIAFGGAAPLHAARLARKLGMKRVIVPVGAGVGSAFGFLRASIAYEVVRTRHVRLDMFDAKMLNELFAAMRAEAETVVRPAAPGETLVESRQAFMRYRGQGHEIAVPLPNEPFAADAAGDLRRRFEATYELVFGRAIPKLEVEALTWTLSIGTDRPLPPPASPVAKLASPAPSGHREVFDPASGLLERAALHERKALTPGMSFDGPALIVEDGTTTVVPTGFIAQINEVGQIVLEDRA